MKFDQQCPIWLYLQERGDPGIMSSANSTSNPFARVVLFYYLYLRSKLVPSDLEKIAKKYSSKPDKLLADLGQKYAFTIPEFVHIDEIHRLCSLFEVPESYSRLIPELPLETEFDSHSDVYSPDYDPLMSLLSGQISISYMKAPALDNMSKVYKMLPGYEPNPKIVEAHAALVPTRSRSNTGTTESANDADAEPTAPKSRHLFDMIAEASLQGKASRGRRSEEREGGDASPLALLHQYMKEHVRVRIILRRNHSVRGSLDTYILAFDRHYNMLLSDVDEEYINNNQKKRAMAVGRFRSQNNVLLRHLSQLVLRGCVNPPEFSKLNLFPPAAVPLPLFHPGLSPITSSPPPPTTTPSPLPLLLALTSLLPTTDPTADVPARCCDRGGR